MKTYSKQALCDMSAAECLSVIESPETAPTSLTYALELYGGKVGAGAALQVVRQFWGHKTPYVREGAVYALEDHVSDAEVFNFLKAWACLEPSPSVREAICEALEAA